MTPRIHNFFSLVPKYKLLLGSFIFLSLYSGALFAFAVQVAPGTVLDPLGVPGAYTVGPVLSYGEAVTTGHDGEILYIDSSGDLVSDSDFTRDSTTNETIIAVGDPSAYGAVNITINHLNMQFDTATNTTQLKVDADQARMLFRDANPNTYQYALDVSSEGLGFSELNSGDSYFDIDPNNISIFLGDLSDTGNSTLFTLRDSTGFIRFATDADFNIGYTDDSADFFIVDIANGNYSLGDNGNAVNGTYLGINDTTGIINARTPQDFEVTNMSGNVGFTVLPTAFYVKMGDADNVANRTSLIVDDQNKAITGTSLISGTKNTSMKVGSIPGLSLPGSAFDYSDSVAGQSSSIGVGDFSGLGGNSNSGYMTWYTGATFAQSLLTTNSGGITGLVTDGTGATYTNEFNLGSSGFTLSSTSGSYTFPLGDGTTDYVLATDGAGQLFWQDPTLIPSDQTLKSNIAPSTYGLSTLLQLNPVSYTLNANNKQQIGFIAQEVEPLIPELIGEIAGGKKGLAYGQLSAVIVKAIQELDLKIKPLTDLTTENNSFAEILRVWFESTTNGIRKIFVQEVHTDQICVKKSDGGEVCVTGDQLDILLSDGSGTSTTTSSDGTADTGTTGNDSGSTTGNTDGGSGTVGDAVSDTGGTDSGTGTTTGDSSGTGSGSI